MNDDLERANPFRKAGAERPRPSFYLPAYIEKAVLAGKNHTFVSGDGVHVAWKRTRWGKVVSGRHIQTRNLYAVMRMRDESVGAMHFVETRNGLAWPMSMFEFFDTCDEKSQAQCDHASAVWAALQQDECLEADEVVLEPHESFVEIAALHISETIKGRRLWSNVISELVYRLYRGAGYTTLVLKAFPLEYGGDETRDDEDDEHPLLHRRKSAMAWMYARELGVAGIDGMDDDGIWMYKNLIREESYGNQDRG